MLSLTSQFGGDPEHVILHGVSAGAGSVALQMLAYGGRNDNLFHGGIGTSIYLPWQPRVASLEPQFSHFVASAGCGNSSSPLSCLRKQPSDILQAANTPAPYPARSKKPLFPFTATIDGDFLRDYPVRQFADGKFVKIPTIWCDLRDRQMWHASRLPCR